MQDKPFQQRHRCTCCGLTAQVCTTQQTQQLSVQPVQSPAPSVSCSHFSEQLVQQTTTAAAAITQVSCALQHVPSTAQTCRRHHSNNNNSSNCRSCSRTCAYSACSYSGAAGGCGAVLFQHVLWSADWMGDHGESAGEICCQNQQQQQLPNGSSSSNSSPKAAAECNQESW